MDVIALMIAHQLPPLRFAAALHDGTKQNRRFFEFNIRRSGHRIADARYPCPRHPTARVGRRCSAAPSPRKEDVPRDRHVAAFFGRKLAEIGPS
jgi:hypothetical protein